VAQYTPISGTSFSSNFSMQDYTPAPGKKMDLYYLDVGPHFFKTLGMPLLLGRSVGPRDTPAAPAVAVVNETFVEQYLPRRNPIGQRIRLGAPFKAPGVKIVGVAADSKYYGLRGKPKPMAFFSLWQAQGSRAYAGDLIIRTAGDPSNIIPEAKRALRGINSRLPILNVTTLQRQISHSLGEQKMITTLCSAFGILALLLAAIGIYGTMAYAVARRTTEIGIRMALGAQRGNILWMILCDSVVLIAAGLAIGFPLALAGTHWIRSFLFGVQAADPAAIAAAVLLIALLALLAGYLPGRRAAKIDPMSAIRYE
jgi:predicted permease